MLPCESILPCEWVDHHLWIDVQQNLRQHDQRLQHQAGTAETAVLHRRGAKRSRQISTRAEIEGGLKMARAQSDCHGIVRGTFAQP